MKKFKKIKSHAPEADVLPLRHLAGDEKS